MQRSGRNSSRTQTPARASVANNPWYSMPQFACQVVAGYPEGIKQTEPPDALKRCFTDSNNEEVYPHRFQVSHFPGSRFNGLRVEDLGSRSLPRDLLIMFWTRIHLYLCTKTTKHTYFIIFLWFWVGTGSDDLHCNLACWHDFFCLNYWWCCYRCHFREQLQQLDSFCIGWRVLISCLLSHYQKEHAADEWERDQIQSVPSYATAYPKLARSSEETSCIMHLSLFFHWSLNHLFFGLVVWH